MGSRLVDSNNRYNKGSNSDLVLDFKKGTSSITHFTLYKGLRKKSTNTFYTILREEVELGGIRLSKVPSSINIPS